MMPLQTYTTFALHKFIEWISVKHSTGLVENLAEFHGYPLIKVKHLVNFYIIINFALFQCSNAYRYAVSYHPW